MANWPTQSVEVCTTQAVETVSGIRAVCVVSSGRIGLANCSSGLRLPAIAGHVLMAAVPASGRLRMGVALSGGLLVMPDLIVSSGLT